MSAPRQPASQPLYLGAGQELDGRSSGVLASFWREQVMAPENRAGNLNILLGVSTFVAGVIGVRTFGGLLVPGF